MVELHDCFSCNELITYEALGLCEEGVCCVQLYTCGLVKCVSMCTVSMCF